MADGQGTVTTGQTDINRILTIFSQTIEEYPVEDLPWRQWVQAFSAIGTPGNVQEVNYVNLSGGQLNTVAEGGTPESIFPELFQKTIGVTKKGGRFAITQEMIEDSRFNEIELGLAKLRQLVTNTYTKMYFDELLAGPLGAADTPKDYGFTTWANAAAHSYSADHAGTAVAQSQPGHVYNSGDTKLYLGDITLAVRHISEHGFTPDTMFITPAMTQKLMDLAGFTKDITATSIPEEFARFGKVVGRLEGLNVIELKGGWLAGNSFVVTAASERPVGYLTKRDPRVDTHGEADGVGGFDVRAVDVSFRAGFETLWPEATCVVTLSA